MEEVNKKIFIEYVSHLYSTDKSYEVIGKTIKAVKLFLESDYQVNRKGYKAYVYDCNPAMDVKDGRNKCESAEVVEPSVGV